MFKFRRWQKRETRSLHLNGKETENTNGLYYSKSVQQQKKEKKRRSKQEIRQQQAKQDNMRASIQSGATVLARCSLVDFIFDPLIFASRTDFTFCWMYIHRNIQYYILFFRPL